MCFLQAPLQPLKDNLESQTYETFEKDLTKYTQYEQAVYLALQDKKAAGKKDILVMVVGAGRGPLITASLQLSAQPLTQGRSMLPPSMWAPLAS